MKKPSLLKVLHNKDFNRVAPLFFTGDGSGFKWFGFTDTGFYSDIDSTKMQQPDRLNSSNLQETFVEF